MRKELVIAAFIGSLCACGKGSQELTSDLNIVGGVEAKDSDLVAQHTVALVDPKGNTFCSGTLISEDLVLTAAHCLFSATDNFYVGFGLKTQGQALKKEQRRGYAALVAHSKYQDEIAKPFMALFADFFGIAKADIAIILLSESAPEPYKPAALAASDSRIPPGVTTVAAGFGLTQMPPEIFELFQKNLKKNVESVPKEAEAADAESSLNANDAEKISDLVKQYKKDFKQDNGVLRYTELQLESFSTAKEAIAETEGKSVCFGDSGGPAYLKMTSPTTQKEMLVTLGISARANCKSTAYFTDIRKYLDWISNAHDVALAFKERASALVGPDKKFQAPPVLVY